MFSPCILGSYSALSAWWSQLEVVAVGNEHVKIDHHMRHSMPLEHDACDDLAATARRRSLRSTPATIHDLCSPPAPLHISPALEGHRHCPPNEFKCLIRRAILSDSPSPPQPLEDFEQLAVL